MPLNTPLFKCLSFLPLTTTLHIERTLRSMTELRADSVTPSSDVHCEFDLSLQLSTDVMLTP